MKTKLFSALAITAILFASCSSDDNNAPETNDGRVQFSSGVNAVQSRVGGASGDQWDGNEHIGIFMRDNAAGKAILSSNVDYTTTSTGASATFTSGSSIYYPVATPAKVDFVAYHPYETLTGDYGYSVNVGTQSSQSAIDLMVASNDNATVGFDKTNPSAVNLVFDHQLAKVKINVIAGAGVNDLTDLAVKIKGMNTTADFDIATATLSNEGTVADIVPYNVASTANYEAILLPTALTNQTIEFTVGGNTYAWTINDAANNTNNVTSLLKGKVYTFDVTVKKNAVVVTGTITPWQSAGSISGTAN